jgi:hypothetical protein
VNNQEFRISLLGLETWPIGLIYKWT